MIRGNFVTYKSKFYPHYYVFRPNQQEIPCAVRYFDRPVRLDGRADLAVRPYGFKSRGGRRYR